MYRAKITSKGQVTLPIELRNQLGLQPGSHIEIQETEHGYVIRKHIHPDVLKKYVGILESDKTADELIEVLRDK